jgi:hypothetical protein
MKMIRWVALLSAVAGLALATLGFGSMRASAAGIVAGTNTSLSCSSFPTGDCTVTVNETIPAGQTLQLLLPDQSTPLNVLCSAGCFPGESLVVPVSPSTLVSGIDTMITPVCSGVCSPVEAIVRATPSYAGLISSVTNVIP